MKKLLMLSYPFPPNATAGAVRSERFARYLTTYGWASEVVTIKPREDLFADATRLNHLGQAVKAHQTATLDPWLWLRARPASNVITRLIRNIGMELFSFPDHMLLWVPFAVRKGLQIMRKTQIDAIYSTSPPHSSHLAGLVLSRWTGTPWVADFRDPWTLNAYRDKGWVRNAMLRFERVLENAVLRQAAVVLANTTANHRNLVAAFPHIDPAKIVHMPNGWEDFPESMTGQPGGLPLTIVHAGTFYPRFKPYALLHALSAWRRGEHDTSTQPLGDGDLKVVLLGARDATTRNLVTELGLADIVEIKPWVALEEARRTMKRADFLWVTLGTGTASATYMPSKIFEYMAAKRSILAFFPEGEAADIIRRTGTGIVFNTDDPGPIITSLSAALEIKRAGKMLPYTPDQRILDQHHAKSIVARFAQLLETL